MIFPRHCSEVGRAAGKPCGDRVYFLSRYLVRDVPGGHEVAEVTLDPAAGGMMRPVLREHVIARPGEVRWWPEKVNLADRARLVRLAREGGARCTLFTGRDEHLTFVCDPDLSGFLTLHVHDIAPPEPILSRTVQELEAAGLFGELEVVFAHHVRDIRDLPADVFPCRAAGFPRTLDSDPMHGGERVAGCMTADQVYRECYGTEFTRAEICPLSRVAEEPFIARCCRSERSGVGRWNGRFGGIVHWGASPRDIAETVIRVAETWRSYEKDRGG